MLRQEDKDIPNTNFRIGEFNGIITANERKKVLAAFNNKDDNTIVLLLSVTAGGTGLNITGGSRLFIYEPL